MTDEEIIIHGKKWKLSHIKKVVEECKEYEWKEKRYVRAESQHHTDSHQHCEICWWTIFESDNPELGTGYSHGQSWLCLECYTNLIGS